MYGLTFFNSRRFFPNMDTTCRTPRQHTVSKRASLLIYYMVLMHCRVPALCLLQGTFCTCVVRQVGQGMPHMWCLIEPGVQVAPENCCGISVQHVGTFDSRKYAQIAYCLRFSVLVKRSSAPQTKSALAGSCIVRGTPPWHQQTLLRLSPCCGCSAHHQSKAHSSCY